MSVLASILGVGASTPFGLDARQSALFVRALKLVPRPTGFFGGERMGTVRSYRLGDEITGARRMAALAASALREAAADAEISEDQAMKVLIALPDSGRDLPEEEAADLQSDAFMNEIERRSRRPIDRIGSEAVRLGHAGFAVMLERALQHVSSGPVLVGAVDTYHHPATLSWLEHGKRLLGETVHNGFIPSEGASFVVLGPPKSDRPAIGKLTFVQSGLEVGKSETDPRTAELMTDLVRRAAENARSKPFRWVMSDVNGERHRVKEWSFVHIRNHELFDVGRTIEQHPYDEMGEMGAATGALYVSQALMGFRAGFAPADEVLIATASDGDERSVILIEAAS